MGASARAGTSARRCGRRLRPRASVETADQCGPRFKTLQSASNRKASSADACGYVRPWRASPRWCPIGRARSCSRARRSASACSRGSRP
eukprot:3351971-Alexandrium_andersonii.AAC.1